MGLVSLFGTLDPPLAQRVADAAKRMRLSMLVFGRGCEEQWRLYSLAAGRHLGTYSPASRTWEPASGAADRVGPMAAVALAAMEQWVPTASTGRLEGKSPPR